MRAFVLFLLTMVLGLMLFLKWEMEESRKVSNEDTPEYFTEKYFITRVDSTGYFGKSNDGKNIYFKKEKVRSSEGIESGVTVLLYFDKSGRIDGPVKIERIE